MHIFPPSAELQCFVGDEIASVQVDPYGLQFSFVSERRLVAEYRVEQTDPDGTSWPYDCQAQPDQRSPTVLNRILYEPIKTVEREDLRLTFKFASGSTLTIMSDLGAYEAGQIVLPETGAYIVF